MSQQRLKRRPTETRTLPRWCPKPRISGSSDPFMGCMECNFVLSLTKSNMGHGDNQALFSEIIYIAGLRVTCLIKRKPLGLAGRDNCKLMSGPLVCPPPPSSLLLPLPSHLLSSPVKSQLNPTGSRRVLGLLAGHLSGRQSYTKSLFWNAGTELQSAELNYKAQERGYRQRLSSKIGFSL